MARFRARVRETVYSDVFVEVDGDGDEAETLAGEAAVEAARDGEGQVARAGDAELVSLERLADHPDGHLGAARE